ncbi:unnamed protein product [Pieris macdunnoughi]|uniref:DALR anticodon binding domain-containing protein n=1 Tax=Pieris macdunnoughi TaxID=345717 RepID=A0A821S5N6_9NEOP|nr:unnamed protein product [Pieris macdunnoughi]
MIDDELDKFSSNVFKFLGIDKEVKGLLVKKHSNNLQILGDYSFPNTVKSWSELLNSKVLQNVTETLLQYLKKDIDSLLQESKSWALPIKKVIEIKDRVHIFLERPLAIRTALSQSIITNENILNNLNKGTSLVEHESLNSSCITSLRLRYTVKVIKNLYLLNEKCSDIKPKVFVTTRSTSKCEESRVILCGAVLNAKTGTKESSISAEELISIRQDELTLIAQHKYGVRVSTDSKWKEFIAHLGESAVAFELLQIRPSSSIKIQFDASSGSSKGVAFILYNCARLETIIRTFNEKVNEGSYPLLPDLDEIQISLLTHEDEWCLVFNYILGLPALLKICVEVSNERCEFRPHLICAYLSSMVKVFSQYYRKVRILTEPRKHLLPVMFARIYMLKSLNDTLKTCLRILNIKSVSQMYFYFLLRSLILRV